MFINAQIFTMPCGTFNDPS